METTSNKPILLVLAAGIGSRYGGLKQIDPVGPNGEIIIDYSIYSAVQAGFGKIVFVIRREIEKDFHRAIGERCGRILPVEYVYQELDDVPEGFAAPPERKKPWGTAHAVRAARHAIHGPFAVINADDFYGGEGFQRLAEFFSAPQSAPSEFALVGFVLRRTLSDHGSVARGVCFRDEQGYLEGIKEYLAVERRENGAIDTKTEVHPVVFSGDEPVSMNMWGFRPAIWELLEEGFQKFLAEQAGNPKAEFLIPTVIDDAISSGRARVKILPTAEDWIGVTYPEDKPHVVESIRRLVERGDYPSPLWP